jgi:zinc protease
MSRTSLHLLLATTLAAASMPLAAQQPTAGELARRLELDPPITAGTLANGMHYFVRQNSFPAKRAELRLVVKAGSALEADDQQGLAHFVEHMAFNGTKRFPKQEIVNYLQSIGMRFGPEVNAYTSFDQTVYMLQLPTEDETFLLKGLDILVDWAHAQAFDPAEIDLERGVILEEWRLRRGANARMQDQQYPVLLKGSRYGERLPIGKPEVIRGFPHDALTRFYREWYRPDLMAVIAVGDFDKARVEQLIKERFSIIPAATAATPVPEFPVPPHAEMYVTVATDPEATSSSMVLYSLVPPRDHLTYGGYRERTIERVYFSMLNARLAEIAQKPDAPFVGAGLSRGYFVRTADAFGLSAQFKEGDAERALDAMFTEVERAARHGFTAGELERARATSLAANSQMYARREQRTSQSRADELVRHVANGEDAVGTEGEYEIQRQVLPAVTLEQINELARTLPPAANRVLVVSAPEKTGVTRPDGEKLLAVVSDVGKKNIEAYHDVAVDVPLLATVPPPAAIAAEQTVPAVGLTEWRLANGVRVVLKPTDFQDDEIIMMGMSPGGSSLVPDSLYTQAQLATSVVGMGGLGQLSLFDLR